VLASPVIGLTETPGWTEIALMTVESLPFRQAGRDETIASLLAKCPVPDNIGGLETQRSTLMDRWGEGSPSSWSGASGSPGARPSTSCPTSRS
jgi:hypothetical protein